MQTPPLYILAGGKSSRFGSDKALAEVNGVPLLRGVIDAFSPLCSTAKLVTGAAKRYEGFGLPVITDRPAGVGPLGGLRAALLDGLGHAGPGWVLIAGCDLVHPDPAWVEQLYGAAGRGPAVASVFRGDRWEPMLGLYHTDLLTAVGQRIEKSSLSLQSLLDGVPAIGVVLPAGLDSLPQANTPEELSRYTGAWGAV